MKPNRICSIDASTNSIAFAVFEGQELVFIGKINFEGKTTYEKVVDASKKVRDFFSSIVMSGVEAVVIEHTVFMNSPKTLADLTLVQGAVLGSMGASGVKLIRSTNPMAWQGFIGNPRLTKAEQKEVRDEFPGKSEAWYKAAYREVRKQRTIEKVEEIYGRTTSDNDIADAVGVGHYAIHNWERLNV